MSPFPQYYFPSSSSPSPSPTYLQAPQILPLSSSLVLTNQDHHNNNIFLPQNYPYDLDQYQTLFLTNTTTNNHPAPTIPSPLRPSPIPAPKKERHSKIQTAQGLRDRRVRLSIDIAREFFDLHDLLGFDKASKTLQWLLLKSRKAIKDLSASKRTASSYNNPADDSECDQAVSELNELGHCAAIDQVDELGDPSASKSVADAKESRAKARARARALTKEKKRSHCNNNNNNNGKNVVASTAQRPIIPISYAAAEAEASDDRHGVVVKRNKLFKFQNNYNDRAIASKEESFNNNNNNNNDSSDNVIHSSSSSSSNLYLLPANILGHQFYGNLSRTDAI